jgi:hypothetical protein
LAWKALSLDERTSEVYISVLIVKMYSEYDWKDIENGFARAIEFNPNNPDAYAWYSMYLSAMGRHARKIDPFSQFVKRNYFDVSFLRG